MSIYYVYAYLSPRTGLPYYIGKGSGYRAWSKHTNIMKPNNHRYIVIMESGLTLVGSLALERRYIAWYGKKCNGSGILMNVNDGGDGNVGHKHSDETKRKIREANKQRSENGYIPWALGKPRSEETKDKLRAARALQTNTTKGRTLSEEHKAKLREAHTRRAPHSEQTRRKISESVRRTINRA